MRYVIMLFLLSACSTENGPVDGGDGPSNDAGTDAGTDALVAADGPDMRAENDASTPDATQLDSGPPPVNSDALFVSLTGNDDNDGRSREHALRTISLAAEYVVAGQTIYVEAGDYGLEEIVFPNQGEAGAPITLEGYRTQPGDRPSYDDFTYESDLDPTQMPLLDAGDRNVEGTSAVQMHSGEYIVLRNFQIRNYDSAVYAWEGQHIEVRQVYITTLGVNVEGSYSGIGIRFGSDADGCLAKDSVIVNAGAEGISITGDNNRIDGCTVYGTEDRGNVNSPDYYMTIAGNANIIENSRAIRVGDLEHVGHGIGIKDSGENNIIRGNEVVGMAGGAYYVRHRAVMNNLFQNNSARDGEFGMLIRDGASANVFEGTQMQDVQYPIVFLDTGEDEGRQFSGNDTTFRDCSFTGAIAMLSFYDYEYDDVYARRNVIENCTIDGAQYLFDVRAFGEGNVFRDSTVRNVDAYAVYENGRTAADIGFVFESIIEEDNGFALP